MSKFSTPRVETEQERWLKFFIEAERLAEADLPEWMQTPEMRQAMSTLTSFSEKERAYHAYQARQNYLRTQRSIQHELDDLRAAVEQERAKLEQQHAALAQERAAKEEERAAKEAERAAKEDALREIERLRALLAGQGESGNRD